MENKTRVNTKVGFVENATVNPIGRCYRFGMDVDPYDPKTSMDSLPNGGMLLDVWPTGEYVWSDQITPYTTPWPHRMYTRCHQVKTEVFSVHSTYQRRSASVGWDSRARKGYPRYEGLNAVYYQSALWNYRQGRLYQPSNQQIQQALEGALLSLWAGRPRRHMNVALALIELRDVKKTITQFAEFAQFGIKVAKGSIQIPKYITSVLGVPSSASFTCQKMAECYLWYTFGVRPTISDVKSFINDVRKGRLVVGGRKRKPLLVGRTYANGFYAEPESYPAGGAFTDYASNDGVTHGTMLATYMGTPWLHAEPKVPSRNNDGYTIRRVYGKVFAKVREQGKWTWKYFPSDFNWSCPLLRTAWELVPFSFVVDWFLDVGKSISRLDDLSWVATTRFAFDEPWVSLCKEDVHYTLQTNSHASIEVSNIRWNGQWGQSWQLRGDWVRTMSTTANWVPERRTITYDRGPASEFGLTYASLWRGLVPEWQGKLKAYQISSGMALLESVAKLI